MEIEYTDINEIRPYHRNPRTHNQTIEELQKSITQYGFTNPILLDQDKQIIAGHGRYKAALKLQGELKQTIEQTPNPEKQKNLEKIHKGQIPTIQLKNLSKKQAKELRIADNRIHELTNWKPEDLKYELRELDTIPGFTQQEIDAILENQTEYEEYTTEDINHMTQELNEHHTKKAENRQKEKITIPCPHCGKNINLNRKELL